MNINKAHRDDKKQALDCPNQQKPVRVLPAAPENFRAAAAAVVNK